MGLATAGKDFRLAVIVLLILPKQGAASGNANIGWLLWIATGQIVVGQDRT